MNIQLRLKVLVRSALVTALIAASAGSSAFAGGSCAPVLRAVETQLTAMPESTAKDAVRELFESAKKAANNYDEEGCLVRANEALAKIAVVR